MPDMTIGQNNTARIQYVTRLSIYQHHLVHGTVASFLTYHTPRKFALYVYNCRVKEVTASAVGELLKSRSYMITIVM